MSDGSERSCKEPGHGLIKALCQHLSEGAVRNTKTAVRICDVPAETRTKHFSSTSMDLYR
jgi:hypothetical protein